MKIRFLPTDENLSLRGNTLKQAIQEDRRMGLVPFMVGTEEWVCVMEIGGFTILINLAYFLPLITRHVYFKMYYCVVKQMQVGKLLLVGTLKENSTFEI